MLDGDFPHAFGTDKDHLCIYNEQGKDSLPIGESTADVSPNGDFVSDGSVCNGPAYSAQEGEEFAFYDLCKGTPGTEYELTVLLTQLPTFRDPLQVDDGLGGQGLFSCLGDDLGTSAVVDGHKLFLI